MKFPIFLITPVLAVGIAIGFFMQSGPDTPVAAVAQNISPESDKLSMMDSSNSDIAELSNLLQVEIRARQSLEQKLEALSERLSDFKNQSQLQTTALPEQTQSAQPLDTEADKDWFNEQALVDSGMTSSQASELKFFFEQQELQQLYLRDQAVREGWNREKYREKIQAFNDEKEALKVRLGDSAYDAYLYASGQPNRVAVSSVLATAPAGVAGIQAGDHILRYDNQRIYSGFELRQATTKGIASDSVSVEIERDGQIMAFYLARGPLGIRMNSVSAAP
jgi:C-terminal processing protease CtpA/Prc